jgi:hypothetical protein
MTSDDRDGLRGEIMSDVKGPDPSATQAEGEVLGEPLDGALGAAAQPDFAKELLRVRRRVTALTVLVCFVLGVAVVSAGLTSYTFYNDYLAPDMAPPEPTGDQAKQIEDVIRGAYSDSLESVTVQSVKGSGGSTQYGFSYHLKNTPATLAGVVSDASGVSGTGYLPTVDALTARLTITELDALLSAWSAQTDKPAGLIGPYDDGLDSTGDSAQAPLVIGGRSYPRSDVWRVSEGYLVKPGETLDLENPRPGTSLVFYIDPKTGKVTYLGSEPAPQGPLDGVSNGC